MTLPSPAWSEEARAPSESGHDVAVNPSHNSHRHNSSASRSQAGASTRTAALFALLHINEIQVYVTDKSLRTWKAWLQNWEYVLAVLLVFSSITLLSWSAVPAYECYGYLYEFEAYHVWIGRLLVVLTTAIAVSYLVSNLGWFIGTAFAVAAWTVTMIELTWSTPMCPTVTMVEICGSFEDDHEYYHQETPGCMLLSYALWFDDIVYDIKLLFAVMLSYKCLRVLGKSMHEKLGLCALKRVWLFVVATHAVLTFGLLLVDILDWRWVYDRPTVVYSSLIAYLISIIAMIVAIIRSYGKAVWTLTLCLRSVAGQPVEVDVRKARLEVIAQLLGCGASVITSMFLCCRAAIDRGSALGELSETQEVAWAETVFWVMAVDSIVSSIMFVLVTGLHRVGVGNNLVIIFNSLRPYCKCPCSKSKAEAGEGEGDARVHPFRNRELEEQWLAKVEELAGRGITLRALLKFYQGLGSAYFKGYEPSLHTTNDVVRQAIIPLTKEAACSLAEHVREPDVDKVWPQKLVTHTWGNKFRDTLAAIYADALGEIQFNVVAALLEHAQDQLEELLMEEDVLDRAVWFCAASVNQHTAICAGEAKDSVTDEKCFICDCQKPKALNKTEPLTADGKSISCELNKFDDMMEALSKHQRFEQLVAVDNGFKIFERAWCIAELARAHRLGMRQKLLVVHGSHLEVYKFWLKDLRVQDMKASRPEDVDEILKKIDDKDQFNRELNQLLFNKQTGAFSMWSGMDAMKRMHHAGRLALFDKMAQKARKVEDIWGTAMRHRNPRTSTMTSPTSKESESKAQPTVVCGAELNLTARPPTVGTVS